MGDFASAALGETVLFAVPVLKAVGTVVRVARAAHKIDTTALTVHGIVESASTVVDGFAALADGRTLAGVGMIALGMAGVFPGVPGHGGKHLGVGAAKASPTPTLRQARATVAADTVSHSAPFRPRTAQSGVYDVGLAKDLRRNPVPDTQVHHVPQSRHAESLIGDFNPRNNVGNEPAIRLPISEHEAVNAAQRSRRVAGSARDLLADEIRILRNKGLSEVLCQGSWERQLLEGFGRRSSKRMAKWLRACFQ